MLPYRLRAGIWGFRIRPSSKSSFRSSFIFYKQYFLKHTKIPEFSTFRPNFFSCGKLLSLSNRFRTGFLGFQIRPSSKSSFSDELWSKFSLFFKTPKDSWVFDFSTKFFSCGKLLSSSNRFRTGISGFQIRPSSKSSFLAELWSKFSIFLKTPKDHSIYLSLLASCINVNWWDIRQWFFTNVLKRTRLIWFSTWNLYLLSYLLLY